MSIDPFADAFDYGPEFSKKAANKFESLLYHRWGSVLACDHGLLLAARWGSVTRGLHAFPRQFLDEVLDGEAILVKVGKCN